MSIQDKITRLQNAKEDIADAITSKGGTVNEGDGFEEFASDIGEIPEGAALSTTFSITEGTLTAAETTITGNLTAVIPDNVTTIGNTVFRENLSITNVVMSNNVTSMQDGYWYNGRTYGTFFYTRNLKTVMLSTSIGNIGAYAFAQSALSEIHIPESVTAIGDSAFISSDLTDIYYTGTQAEWEQISIGENAIPQGVTIHYEYVPN